jgi:hypothetical protein
LRRYRRRGDQPGSCSGKQDHLSLELANTSSLELPRIRTLDVLVVVDSLDSSLVETSLLGALERSELPDVCHGVAVSSRTVALELIDLVIQNDKLLPLGVENPAL